MYRFDQIRDGIVQERFYRKEDDLASCRRYINAWQWPNPGEWYVVDTEDGCERRIYIGETE